MAHFAKIENSLITQVIVVDNNDILDTDGNESESIGIQFCTDLLGGEWIQTSYNSTIRKNYACIGDSYDTTRDAFIAPKPYPSWLLDEDTCWWEAPVPYPDVEADEKGMPIEAYQWNEELINWVLLPEQGE